MTTIQLLESPLDPQVGGCLLTFPSGYALQLAWGPKAGTPHETGKELAAKALQRLLDTGRTDDAERTNWSSAAAGLTEVYRQHLERAAKRTVAAGG